MIYNASRHLCMLGKEKGTPPSEISGILKALGIEGGVGPLECKAALAKVQAHPQTSRNPLSIPAAHCASGGSGLRNEWVLKQAKSNILYRSQMILISPHVTGPKCYSQDLQT